MWVALNLYVCALFFYEVYVSHPIVPSCTFISQCTFNSTSNHDHILSWHTTLYLQYIIVGLPITVGVVMGNIFENAHSLFVLFIHCSKITSTLQTGRKRFKITESKQKECNYEGRYISHLIRFRETDTAWGLWAYYILSMVNIRCASIECQ